MPVESRLEGGGGRCPGRDAGAWLGGSAGREPEGPFPRCLRIPTPPKSTDAGKSVQLPPSQSSPRWVEIEEFQRPAKDPLSAFPAPLDTARPQPGPCPLHRAGCWAVPLAARVGGRSQGSTSGRVWRWPARWVSAQPSCCCGVRAAVLGVPRAPGPWAVSSLRTASWRLWEVQ